ncbi:hypothetical protein diail_5942 [Diaporthe ilicicola]|nr:hypothetical protein diail_5942 [Diaporthe ilicicola]
MQYMGSFMERIAPFHNSTQRFVPHNELAILISLVGDDEGAKGVASSQWEEKRREKLKANGCNGDGVEELATSLAATRKEEEQYLSGGYGGDSFEFLGLAKILSLYPLSKIAPYYPQLDGFMGVETPHTIRLV